MKRGNGSLQQDMGGFELADLDICPLILDDKLQGDTAIDPRETSVQNR